MSSCVAPAPSVLSLPLLPAPGTAVVIGGFPLIESDVYEASPPLSAELGNQEHVAKYANSPWVGRSLFSHEDWGQQSGEACTPVAWGSS